jgi:hypothetical protein
MQLHGNVVSRTAHDYVVDAVQMVLDGRVRLQEEAQLFRALCLAIEQLIVSDEKDATPAMDDRASRAPSDANGASPILTIDPRPTIEAIRQQIAA